MLDHIQEGGSPAREGRGVSRAGDSDPGEVVGGGGLNAAQGQGALLAIPDHELIRRIGGGSYGEVWLARNIMGAYRAVKIVSRSAFDNDRPFEREFHGIQKFEPISRSHPSQIAILHVGRTGDCFYYVMELADPANAECGVRNAECPGDGGGWKMEDGKALTPALSHPMGEGGLDPGTYVPRTLKSEVARRGRLPFAECLEIGLALTTALEHLHKHGLVHRDVKPSNVIFVNGIPKLADIGLVTNVDATVSFVGTEGFIPPEGPGTPQADIYSLGKVLYEISTGKDRQDFPEPPTMLGEFPDRQQMVELGEIVKKACARDVGTRYQSAEAMQADLLLLKTGGSVQRAHVLERRLKITRRVTLAIAAIMALGVVPYYVAIKEARLAKATAQSEAEQRITAQRHLYAANMNLAQQAWEENRVERLGQLLKETAAYVDRDFEWYYWYREGHSEIKTLLGHAGPVDAVSFSLDGRQILSASDDKTAMIWDAATGNRLRSLEGHGGWVGSAAFSPDRQRVVTGDSYGILRLWDAASGKKIFMLKAHDAGISGIAFCGDGTKFVTSSHDKVAKLWNAANGTKLMRRQAHSSRVTAVAFSQDGRWIVSGLYDGTAEVWDARSGKELLTLRGHTGRINSVALSPDNQQIATASDDRSARIWNTATGKELRRFEGHSDKVHSVVFSPDASSIATGGEDGTARIWDSLTGKERFVLKGQIGAVDSVTFSPDGRRLVTGGDDGTVKVWALDTAKAAFILDPHDTEMRYSAICAGRPWVVSQDRGHTVRVWDTVTRKELLTLKGHKAQILCVAFSPDGKRIATGGRDRLVKVWEAGTGQELLALEDKSDAISAITFSPDSRRIAAAAGDRVKVWGSAGGSEEVTINTHSSRVSSVTFSPDGRSIATGSADNKVQLWEAATGNELRTFQGHDDHVLSVTFSPDGQRILSGSDDNTARVWDAATGKELLRLKGHNGTVLCATFSPNGHRIVTGCGDGTAKLWNSGNGRELLTLKGHSQGVWWIAFLPDGKEIVSGSLDGSVRIWKSASPEQVAAWQSEEEALESLAATRRESFTVRRDDPTLSAQDPGAIKQWLVLLPIAIEDGNAPRALEQEQLAAESGLRPRANEAVKIGNRNLMWSAVRLENYLIDFNRLAGLKTEWSVAYAVSYIHSETTRRNLLLKVGSDDESKIYLNGHPIYQHLSPRSYHPDEDQVSGVEIKPGVNVLVFKVVNQSGDWLGSIRFTDSAGRAVSGFKVSLDPVGTEAL